MIDNLSSLFIFSLRARSGVDPPDPFSNSVVKHASADDSWGVAPCESRSVRRVILLLGPTIYGGACTAGWSSLVARRAHNPKVTGSNPVPATKQTLMPVNKVIHLLTGIFIQCRRYSVSLAPVIAGGCAVTPQLSPCILSFVLLASIQKP